MWQCKSIGCHIVTIKLINEHLKYLITWSVQLHASPFENTVRTRLISIIFSYVDDVTDSYDLESTENTSTHFNTSTHLSFLLYIITMFFLLPYDSYPMKASKESSGKFKTILKKSSKNLSRVLENSKRIRKESSKYPRRYWI